MEPRHVCVALRLRSAIAPSGLERRPGPAFQNLSLYWCHNSPRPWWNETSWPSRSRSIALHWSEEPQMGWFRAARHEDSGRNQVAR